MDGAMRQRMWGGNGFATLPLRNHVVISSLHTQITASRMDSPSPAGLSKGHFECRMHSMFRVLDLILPKDASPCCAFALG